MKKIKPTPNAHHWPRSPASTIECRERDLVVRITNWLDDEDEPGYAVEVYIGGVFDWNESQSFTMYEHKHEIVCKQLAIAYANKQVAKLL